MSAASQQAEPERTGRLNSWKEIAAYFGRAERTVRRWETTCALPVHRLAHEKRSSVYAYRAELDAWLESRKPELDHESQPAAPLPAAGLPSRRRSIAWAPVGCLVVLLAASWLARPPAHAPSIGAVRQLTISPASDLSPAFSPDGSQIAFASNRSGHREIYVRSLASGSAERRITFNGDDNVQPAWSPDGRELAYVDLSRGAIAVIPASGGPARYLTEGCDQPKWAPGGRMLVCRSSSPNSLFTRYGESDTTLMLVGTDGWKRPLTQPGNPPGGHNQPSWLADGRHVVFTAITARYALSSVSPTRFCRPWLIDTGTGALQPIGIRADSVEYPTFAPDGSTLYFSGNTDHPGLWRARVDSNGRADQEEPLMLAGGVLPTAPVLSPDGKHVAFSQIFSQRGIWSLALDSAGSPSGVPQPVTLGGSRIASELALSRDGSRIAYSTAAQGSEETIMVANVDGTSAVAVSPAGERASNASWLGAGLSVGYESFRDGAWSFWISGLHGPSNRLDPRLDLRKYDRLKISPDGTRIAGHARTPAGLQVAVAELRTGVVREVTPPDRNIGFPAWSRDGRWISAQERIGGRSSAVVVPAGGGAIRLIQTGGIEAAPFDWSPDGERILFVGIAANRQNLYWISLSSGRVRQLTAFGPLYGRVGPAQWSPRNDGVIFLHEEVRSNIYVADLR